MAKAEKDRPFFESQAEVAEYLGMSIVQFLTLAKAGKFGVSQRPKDATPVWWKCDIDKWLAGGRPVRSVMQDVIDMRRQNTT